LKEPPGGGMGETSGMMDRPQHSFERPRPHPASTPRASDPVGRHGTGQLLASGAVFAAIARMLPQARVAQALNHSLQRGWELPAPELKETIMSLNRGAKLSILLACAGVFGCDPAKKVESAQQDQQKAAIEANEKRAELSRELTQEQRQQRADLEQRQHEAVVGQQREAVQLGTEQINERSRVESQIADDSIEARSRLNKASSELDQKRQDIQSRSRERLSKINTRANEIATKAQTAPAEGRNGVNQALTGFQETRAMAERDIEALSTVAAENFKRAEKTVDQELAQLEKKLDSAQNKL
jgi:hypothetical protein